MGNDPRWVPPGSLVEVTSRTVHGRFLLRPSRDLNEIVQGILARAAARYDVEICAFIALSNHMHLLLVPADAEQLGLFMGYVNANLAKEAGRLHRWREKFWGRRYSHVVLSNEPEAHEQRLRYLLEQGCKENLVRRPEDWPGASSTQALLAGQAVRGVWFDRTREYEARRCGKRFGRYEFSEVLELELAPLPAWRGRSAGERRQRVLEIVREIEAETRQRLQETGRRPLGVRKILRQDPHDRPVQSKRSPRPLVHAVDPAVRRSLRIAFSLFRMAYRQASEDLQNGKLDVEFPPGSHRPRLPFCRGQPRVALA